MWMARPDLWVAGGFLALSGGWLVAMFLYPAWYNHSARPGDTIGIAYANFTIPRRSVYGFLFVNVCAFNFLPWQIATICLAAQPFLGPVLITMFRSRVQMYGLFGSVICLGFAAVAFFDPFRAR